MHYIFIAYSRLSRRESPEAQEALRLHCAHIVERVELSPAGRYVFKDVVTFHDQSYLYSWSFRPESWVAIGDPSSDINGRAAGNRIILLDCVRTDRVVPEFRKSWDSTHDNKEILSGNYVTADKLDAYFSEYVFPNCVQNSVVYLDNASIGKTYEISFRNMSVEEIESWIWNRNIYD